MQRTAPEVLVAEGVGAKQLLALLEETVGRRAVRGVGVALHGADGQVHRHEAEVQDQPGACDRRQPPEPLGDRSHPRSILGS